MIEVKQNSLMNYTGKNISAFQVELSLEMCLLDGT